MTIDNEWTREIEILRRQLAEAQRQLDIAKHGIPGPIAEQGLRFLAMEAALQEERAKREEAERRVTWCPHMAGTDGRDMTCAEYVAAALAGAVAVQEALQQFIAVTEPGVPTGIMNMEDMDSRFMFYERIQAVRNSAMKVSNLDALTAGRALLEPLRKDKELLDWCEANSKDMGSYIELRVGEGIAANVCARIRAAIDAAIAAGKERSHDK